MSHDARGSGRPVPLLHSRVCDRRMWRPQVESLTSAHREIASDLRGFGETPMLPGEFSYADDMLELLDTLDIAG